MEYKAGDIVTLAENATYYNGKKIPAWVKSNQWIIKSVKGARVVIDKSVDGTQSIKSPVHIQNLIKMEESIVVSDQLLLDQQSPEQKPPEETVNTIDSEDVLETHNKEGNEDLTEPVNIVELQNPEEIRNPTDPDTTEPEKQEALTEELEPTEQLEQTEQSEITETIPKEMQISLRGVDLIAKYEGCRLAAYKCPAGIWTIGYGHTAGVQPGDTLASAEAAKELLATDLKKYAGYVNACMQKGQILFSLNQNQFDALTSFTYNCGKGSLRKLVSGRDAATIADTILKYNKGGGRVLAGLVKRREEERALFLS